MTRAIGVFLCGVCQRRTVARQAGAVRPPALARLWLLDKRRLTVVQHEPQTELLVAGARRWQGAKR